MDSNNHFVFYGCPGGIGNRVEQLIYIQEYCVNTNSTCEYIWRNKFLRRTYNCLLTFDRITITTKKLFKNHNRIDERNMFMRGVRTAGFVPKYQFKFNINISEPYDTIIHIRGGDRLSDKAKNVIYDYSSNDELHDFIEKTITFVNNNIDIRRYTIVSDEPHLIKYVVKNIRKKFCKLSYGSNINKDWLDYYYLTKATKRIIMCSKLSTYSLTASMLANLPIEVLFISTKLDRFKAKVHMIDTKVYSPICPFTNLKPLCENTIF